jgi:hypothetical protein
MGPVSILNNFPEGLNLLIGFLVGVLFGFALEQAGFSSSRRLAGMFYGYDTTVLKVFFTAALVAMVGSQLMGFFGLLDLRLVYVNPYYITATVVGGVIMGAGFIMGGFCPGTGICALAIGKIDALFYLLGGLAGAFLFAETYPMVYEIAMDGYKGQVKVNDWMGISPGLFTFIVIIAAVAMFWMAELAEKRFARPQITSEI